MPTKKLERYAWLSIAAAIVTIGLKMLAWRFTGSIGFLSDALESLVNLAAAILALSMLKLAALPPDKDHPFGRSKAEYFSAGMEGAMIVVAAGAIVWTAIPRLLAPQPIEAPLTGMILTALATAINLVVGILLIRAGRREDSITLEADGKHLMTDVWTSVGVIAGVAIAAATGWFVVDPILGIAVAGHILWEGFGLVRRSLSGLLDVSISEADQKELTRLFAEYSRRYGISFHALRTRQAGARRFITFHILVPDQWTVAHAHKISEEIESRMRAMVSNAHIMTHIEPVSDPASYDDQALDR